jgi:hypothetical protein
VAVLAAAGSAFFTASGAPDTVSFAILLANKLPVLRASGDF